MSLSIISVLVMTLVGAMTLATAAIQGAAASGSSTERGASKFANQLSNDLWLATGFLEFEQTRITMSVPDRDADGTSEVIGYSWSGTPGDPVIRSYNGAETAVFHGAHGFSLSEFSRTVAAKPDVIPPVDPSSWGYFSSPSTPKRLLLICVDATSASEQEVARQSLVESLGYLVTMISETATQSELNDSIMQSDVVYVPEDTSSTVLGPKLRNCPVGLVNEDGPMSIELGFALTGLYITGGLIELIDVSHEITTGLSAGEMELFLSQQPTHVLDPPLGAGVTLLATADKYQGLPIETHEPTFMCIEQGGETHRGIATARRVHLPWGGTNFDINALNDNGKDLLGRALCWAAEPSANSQTFGFEEQFSVEAGQVRRKQVATLVSLAETGQVNLLSAYVKGSSGQVRLAIYTDNDGEPGDLLAQTLPAATSATDWVHVPLTSPVQIAAGDYWLAVAFESNNQAYFHGGGTDPGQLRIRAHNAVSNGFIPAWGASDDYYTLKMSGYGTYLPN